jgi:tRNA pseudouridine-54 N-methylase
VIQTIEDCLDLSKFDQETLLSLDLAQVSILSLELLKIHVIPGLASDITAMTSKVEAFPKASSTALQVDVPMASAASTIPGLTMVEESKKTDLEMVVAAKILYLEEATDIILQVEVTTT